LLDDGANTYTYDSANRLISVNNTQSSTLSTYGYDGLGNRVSQTVNGVTTSYALDLNAGLTQVLSDGANTYLYGNGRIGELQPGGFAYHLGDALGSVRQLTDASGSVTLAKNYEPYGSVLGSVGSGGSAFAFTGEQYDAATKLTFLRTRYLSNVTGRFLTRDEWEGNLLTPASFNSWLYGNNDPLNYSDPSGLRAVRNWNEFQTLAAMKGIDISKHKIGVGEMNEIARNFEGNPYSNSEESTSGRVARHPNDVHCFNNSDPDVAKRVYNRWGKVSPFDLNAYDWLFSGWTDYWAWRARLENQEVILTDPNILKAIAVEESAIGHLPDIYNNPDDPGHRQSLMNITGPSGYYELLRDADQPGNEYFGYRYGLTWGLMDVNSTADRYDPVIEVGLAVRVLYAMFYSTRKFTPELRNATRTEIWKTTLQSYGPKPGDPLYLSCYGELLWTTATTGKRYGAVCDGTRLVGITHLNLWVRDLGGEHASTFGNRR
jgi:RHS repeat-associated protein